MPPNRHVDVCGRSARRDNGPMTTPATTTFTRMDQSTADQWAVIGAEVRDHQAQVADRVLAMLRSLDEMVDGFAVDQLTHCLQTATRAERDGADDQFVVACLCHDVGKAVSVPNHPRIAAEILRPYVRPEITEVIRTHQDFQGRHYYAYFDRDPHKRERYRAEPWFALAEQFADEWDQVSFDPDYPTFDLAHFEARVREVFAHPHGM
jgi:predicted HD phosphohydrolase